MTLMDKDGMGLFFFFLYLLSSAHAVKTYTMEINPLTVIMLTEERKQETVVVVTRAAATGHPRPGGLKSRNLFPHSSGGWNFVSKP